MKNFYIKLKISMNNPEEVKKLLSKDGIQNIDVNLMKNQTLTKLEDVINSFPKGQSFAKRIVNASDSAPINSGSLICQNLNEGVRKHYHPEADEFWIILKGEHKFEIGKNEEVFLAGPGDIVYCPKNVFHRVTIISKEQGIRFAISLEEKIALYE